jgi:hypothetical protein
MKDRLHQLLVSGLLLWIVSILGLLAVLLTAPPVEAAEQEKPYQLRGVEHDRLHILISVHRYEAYIGSGVVERSTGRVRLYMLDTGCKDEGKQLTPDAMFWEAKALLICTNHKEAQ